MNGKAKSSMSRNVGVVRSREDWSLAIAESTSICCCGIQEKNRGGYHGSSRFSFTGDWEYAGGAAAEVGVAFDGRGAGKAGVLQSHRFLQRSHGAGDD